MKRSLSANRIYAIIGTAFFITCILFHIIIFLNTKSLIIRGSAIVFSLILFLLGILFILLLRNKLILFSDSLSLCIDNILNNTENISFDLESETLQSKFSYKLRRLYETMQNDKRMLEAERKTLQETISDISHQVKTPITNLKMYNDILSTQQLSPEKEREFHKLMESQISKLDFLMQAMIKMSRLETGIIKLSISPAPIYDTLALALAGIELSAEQKGIAVTVDCNPSVCIPHDRKWTAEALFNILDNAVKYTPAGGKISITTAQWETAVKIDISDTGCGIPEQHFAQVFKRFYREEAVHDIRGVGIGLYLCREIISRQGGYIQLKSTVGQGSTFSVFLPKSNVSKL